MNMKNILLVATGDTRGNTGGIAASLMKVLLLNKHLVDISFYDISFITTHKKELYFTDKYFNMPDSKLIRLFKNIPLVRRYFREEIICREFEKHLKKYSYDLIIIYEMQPYCDRLIKIAHSYDTKVMIRPWGSDVLRANTNKRKRHEFSFKNVDYVSGYIGSSVILYIQREFHVESERIHLTHPSLPLVPEILKYEGKVTREDMIKELGFPESSCYIICGYSGSKTHFHHIIIDSISKVKNEIPKDAVLVFPLTYGGTEEYCQSIKEKCDEYALQAYLILQFLTQKQMAFLHLVANLFISIQPTDNGNGFLIEELVCGNKVICGKWLKYEQFEGFGVPYFQCDSYETLSDTITDALKAPTSKVPQQLMDVLRQQTPERVKEDWAQLFNTL